MPLIDVFAIVNIIILCSCARMRGARCRQPRRWKWLLSTLRRNRLNTLCVVKRLLVWRSRFTESLCTAERASPYRGSHFFPDSSELTQNFHALEITIYKSTEMCVWLGPSRSAYRSVVMRTVDPIFVFCCSRPLRFLSILICFSMPALFFVRYLRSRQ